MTAWAYGYAPEHWMMADFTDLANVSCDITVHPTQPQDSPSAMSNFNALISGLPWHNLGKDILTPLT
jgi:hypothetical protein